MKAQEEAKPPKQDGSDQREPGFFVHRCTQGEGFIIDGSIEVRLARCDSKGAHIAIRAPRDKSIRITGPCPSSPAPVPSDK